jgi:4-hydroxyphenylpyruvate dioxygenase-like putative hemolysin
MVERRGYDGYGAFNQPIRMAAQSRLRDESELDL